MTKYLGLDFGEKTIGVAVSHNGQTATGLKTLRRKDPDALRPCLKELKIILREYDIKNIVLGFPKNLDGEDSARCAETLAFKEKLLRYFKNINVVLWDERLSTRAVLRVFSGRRVRKNQVDTMAAVYILQGYLDSLHTNGKEVANLNEDDGLVVIDEDGTEHPLQILSNREDENGIYLLAIDEDEGEAYYFLCNPSDDDSDDVILEQIDDEHADFKRIFELFKEDYEEFGIEFE